jgi:hypothetical protein
MDMGHAVFIATLTAALAVAAEEPNRAEDLFQKARTLMGQSDFATACPMLEEAYSLDHGGGTLLALALCHEGAGRPATALREYRESLSQAVTANRPDRVMLAESHVQKLEASVPRITAHILVPEPAELQLTLDDAPLDRASLTAGVPVDPGKHEMAATAPGIAPWRTTVEVLASARWTVVDVPGWTRTVTAPRAATRATWPRTLGITVGAVGLVAVGVGSYFGAASFSAESDSRKNCMGTVCSPSGVSLNHDARRDALISDVTLSIGGVALVTGIILVVRSSLRPRVVKQAQKLRAWAAATGGGVGFATAW